MLARHASYNASSEGQGLIFEYKYGVLRDAGNKKYGRKAEDKGIEFVAVAITNDTDQPFNFTNDTDLYADDRLVTPLEPEEVKKEVRQISGLYMLWGLFWLNITNCENGDCSFIPLPIGLLIGFGNMGIAQKSNKNFVQDMKFHSLANKTIEPGQTVYGILPIRAFPGQELQLRWK